MLPNSMCRLSYFDQFPHTQINLPADTTEQTTEIPDSEIKAMRI